MQNNQESSLLHTIYLGFGTNVGDRLGNLQAAVDKLVPQVQVQQVSSVYQTPPWGYTDQAEFLNIVVRATTSLPPDALLRYLKDLETQVGRTATFHWGPREIDLDILFYDDRVLELPNLRIPHPMLHKRAFVLVPLAEIAPNLIHPVL
ncbi:MAG: 2-amino-4-hydroxy-6-hydroxymethyldihydropteridine diphosphokinase, partial [Anaerolineales bacterium]